MFKIKLVEINDIWGEYSLKIPLNEKNNLFIGKNGTGKSTFLNILTAVLKLDKQTLSYYDFSDVKIVFIDGKTQKTLQVTKEKHSPILSRIIYKLSSKKIGVIRVDDREDDYLYTRQGRDDLKNILNVLENLVLINDLSTTRLSKNDDLETLYEKYSRRTIEKMELMDKKIEVLIDGLQKYRFVLERKLIESSKKFQQAVLEALMYNKEWDKSNKRKIDFNPKEFEEGIEAAYMEFDFSQKEAKKKAKDYILNTFGKNSNGEDKQSLLFRMEHILEKLNILKKEKEEILKPLEDLIEILKLFIDDKNFSFDTLESLQITKNNKVLKIKDLSSGEKQLLILFLQTLLQDKKEVIFIADEPELSLHIVWQKNLIRAIKILNPNSQIIFATHSTEICGQWREFTKRLEDYIC